MMRFAMITLLLAVGVDNAFAATLTGTVTDPDGNGLAGVQVALALSGTRTTTDELGGWTLDWPTTSLSAPAVRDRNARWTEHGIDVVLPEASELSIDAFSAQGGLLGRIAFGRVDAGLHRVPASILPEGIGWVRVVADGRSEVLTAGLGGTIRGGAGAGGRVDAARSLVVPDTLLFSWRSSVRARHLLKAMPTSGILVRIDTSDAWILPIQGTMVDARDQRTYRTVRIGTQTWMAENLNWSGAGVCRGADGGTSAGSAADCEKYGRQYRWSEAMGLSSTFDASTWAGTDFRVKGACPTGWHVPSDSEWIRLTTTVEKDPRVGTYKAGQALKSISGWNASNDTVSGFDAFGFTVLPVGFQGTDSYFRALGTDAYFWSASESSGTHAWLHAFYFLHAYATRNPYDKTYRFSLRCLQD